jgi:hypothetical protein
MTLLYGHAHNLKTREILAVEPTIQVNNTDFTSPTPLATPTPKPKTQKELIQESIRSTFGEYSDTAFLLLKGNSKCGGENATLNPHAVYTNKDGSRDRGIFQISDKYHPITDSCAFNYDCNIKYAWRMFKNDNYTFVRWTAGRCMGI